MDHLGQAVGVFDQQGAAAPLDNPNSGQAIELSGDGLAVGADPACDLHMGRRRHDAGALAFLGPEARQPQQFGLDAVVDGQSAELVDPRRQRPNGLGQPRQQGMREPGLGLRAIPGTTTPDIEAIMQLVRASTLAEREPPSIAGNSPKISPAANSRKLTALPTEE